MWVIVVFNSHGTIKEIVGPYPTEVAADKAGDADTTRPYERYGVFELSAPEGWRER